MLFNKNIHSKIFVILATFIFSFSGIDAHTITKAYFGNTHISLVETRFTADDNGCPIIANYPTSIALENSGDSCGGPVSWIPPRLTENCPPSALNSNGIDFTILGIYNGKYYYISDNPLTPANGSAAAQRAAMGSAHQAGADLGGFLLDINDAAENDFLVSVIPSAILTGFTDELSEGSFGWYSGAPTTYTNWNGGEPNNAGGEDYVELSTAGPWNDIDISSTSRRFVIELSMPPPGGTSSTLALNPSTACIGGGILTALSGGTPVQGSNPGDSGTYAGTGVTDNSNGTFDFDPAAAGLGLHTISYTYENGGGCTLVATEDIEVFDYPVASLSCPDPSTKDCEGPFNCHPMDLNPGTVTISSGTVSGSAAPYTYGNPNPGGDFFINFSSMPTNTALELIYTLTSSDGCSSSASCTFEVKTKQANAGRY